MKKLELNVPAGNLPSLKAAADAGADTVYFGFNTRSNLRMYPGLNFTPAEAEEGIGYLHKNGKKAFLTVNIFPQSEQLPFCKEAIERAENLGFDAVVIADPGLMVYAKEKYPSLTIHCSVLGKTYNPQAVKFYQRFGIRRVTLPCLINLEEIKEIKKTGIEVEVFAAGRVIGVNREGCLLNSYLAGWPITTQGSCTPVEYLTAEEDGCLRLKETVIGKLDSDGPLSYPAICMGHYKNLTLNSIYRIMREATSLSVLEILPQLVSAGVDSLKIEGRQRSKNYVTSLTKIFREAIDEYFTRPEDFRIKNDWQSDLNALAEGGRTVDGYRDKGY